MGTCEWWKHRMRRTLGSTNVFRDWDRQLRWNQITIIIREIGWPRERKSIVRVYIKEWAIGLPLSFFWILATGEKTIKPTATGASREAKSLESLRFEIKYDLIVISNIIISFCLMTCQLNMSRVIYTCLTWAIILISNNLSDHIKIRYLIPLDMKQTEMPTEYNLDM